MGGKIVEMKIALDYPAQTHLVQFTCSLSGLVSVFVERNYWTPDIVYIHDVTNVVGGAVYQPTSS